MAHHRTHPYNRAVDSGRVALRARTFRGCICPLRLLDPNRLVKPRGTALRLSCAVRQTGRSARHADQAARGKTQAGASAKILRTSGAQ